MRKSVLDLAERQVELRADGGVSVAQAAHQLSIASLVARGVGAPWLLWLIFHLVDKSINRCHSYCPVASNKIVRQEGYGQQAVNGVYYRAAFIIDMSVWRVGNDRRLSTGHSVQRASYQSVIKPGCQVGLNGRHHWLLDYMYMYIAQGGKTIGTRKSKR